MSEVKKLVEIVDNVHSKFKEEYGRLAAKEKEELIKELYKNDIPVIEFINEDKSGYSHSSEYIMAITKIHSHLDGLLWLEAFYYFNEHDLIKELENDK